MLIGLAAGSVMLLLSPDFLALHLVMVAAVGISAGLATGRAVLGIDRDAAHSAGGAGGTFAGLGYALPFIAYYLYRFITFNDAEFARRANQLTEQETAAIQQAGFVIGPDYFRQQDVSFIFFFLILGGLIGWLFGMVGGLFAKSRA
ncbi:MAG: hypothetical protein HC853_07805 [Anaerolineae bacterium]|nr:hypothetical protein [Anaerolineae bacterium]